VLQLQLNSLTFNKLFVLLLLVEAPEDVAADEEQEQ
jgi:hypothetical protein